MAVLASGLFACRSPRPASIEDWNACVIDHQGIKAGPEDTARFTGGEGHALWVNAEWGRSMFVSEYSFGELMIALPATLEAGKSYEPAAESMFQEGGQLVVYRSKTFTGNVTVVEASPQSVTLKLALRATAPSVDLDKRGEAPLEGTITAKRVASQSACD